MRRAKARKRERQVTESREVGTIITTGCFGNHTIRAINCDHETHNWIEIDGRSRKPRTKRGCWKILLLMIAKESNLK